MSRAGRFLTHHWPLLAGVGLLLAVTAGLLAASMAGTEGRLVYPLDDPYIHMAMAKNFSQHGVWGITKYGFTSSSSSPLWTLLLSLVYLVVGPNEPALLILNLVFAVLVLVLVDRLTGRHGLSQWMRFAVLVGLVMFVPLPAVLFTGQEHVLQVFLSIALAWAAAETLTEKRRPWQVAALGLLLTATRYEGMFLVLLVAGLLVARRRARAGLAVAGAGLLPIVAYGVVSVAKGWYFLPNSVLMKSHFVQQAARLVHSGVGRPEFWKALANLAGFWGLKQIATTPHVVAPFLVVLLLGAILLRARPGFWRKEVVFGFLFLAGAFLHMHFARPGPLHRYEAYLVGMGITAIGMMFAGMPQDRTRMRVAGVAVGLALAVMGWEGARTMVQVPLSSRNIYEQQYQMGLFLRQFYQHEAVAANDMGAVNYLADIRCLDTWGLASMDVARAKARAGLSSELLGKLADSVGVRVAVVYDVWLTGGMAGGVPRQWAKVGCWRIRDNIASACDSVTFFACRPEEQVRLKDCLRQFSASLPRAVVQTGAYVSGQ